MRYRYQVLLSALPLLLVAGYAYSQGYQPNNLIGPITISGDVTGNGAGLFNSLVATTSVAAGTNVVAGSAMAAGISHSSYIQLSGGDSASVAITAQGATDSSIILTPSGTGSVSAGSSNFITTGKYCTTANCSSNYISNDTFGTTTFIGAASFSNNVSIIGFAAAGDYFKLDATAVNGGNACSAGNEGKIRRDAASGGTTGARTRYCVCTSDGGGTPAYAWQTIGTGTVGTTTACNP